MLTFQHNQESPSAVDHRSSRYGLAALSDEAARLAAAPKASRHKQLFAAAAALGELAAGGELSEALAYGKLESVARARGDICTSDVHKQLRHGFKQGQRRPRRAPTNGPEPIREASEARLRILEWWQHVETDPALRNRKGATTVRICAALALEMLRCGKVETAESFRELSEKAGVSIATIHNHQGALGNYLRVSHPKISAEQGGRSIWRPRAKVNKPEASHQGIEGLFTNARPDLAAPSANHWRAWSTGWRVFHLVSGSDQEWSVSELARSTGLHQGSIRRILRRLEADGMVERHGEGWRSVETAEPPVCLSDWQQLRHDRYTQDRILWRAWRSGRQQALEKWRGRRHERQAA